MNSPLQEKTRHTEKFKRCRDATSLRNPQSRGIPKCWTLTHGVKGLSTSDTQTLECPDHHYMAAAALSQPAGIANHTRDTSRVSGSCGWGRLHFQAIQIRHQNVRFKDQQDLTENHRPTGSLPNGCNFTVTVIEAGIAGTTLKERSAGGHFCSFILTCGNGADILHFWCPPSGLQDPESVLATLCCNWVGLLPHSLYA